MLVVDDILATGGTADAAAQLIRQLGANVIGFSFFLELGFLNGRAQLGDVVVESLVTLGGD